MSTGNPLFSGLGTTIFTTMSALAVQEEAINLGQGFPDEDGPAAIREVAAQALLDSSNQYPPMRGTLALRSAIAAHDARFYGLTLDPASDIVVTSGATEALACCLLALLDEGDEAVVIEPFYDSYVPMIRRAGAVPRFVRLEPPHWQLPRDALARAMSSKTRVLLLNSPHNPTGAVLDADDIDFLAALLDAHPQVTAVCDEVYEHLLFDDRRHQPLLAHPAMAKRAVRIGSAGKSFALTGWKVGYICGDAALIEVIAKAHQFLTFTIPPNLQAGVAFGLGLPDRYFADYVAALCAKRDRLARGLAALGFDCLETAGSFFLSCSYARFSDARSDVFAQQLVMQQKVATIPYTPFYDDARSAPSLIRFCFAKRDEVLDAALVRLMGLQGGKRTR